MVSIFEDSALKELAESIRNQGVLSPLLVRPLTDQSFEIIAGARRYRAAQMVEAPTVPVRIVNLTHAEALEAQLIENLQRRDVHPLEEAQGFNALLNLEETGTGKELIARAVHSLSPRRERTFVRLNCAAIPSGLVESELFGHDKGAFTGALMQKCGRFELADRGTLFLDEIGDISLDLQPKLLRALQEQEFERLGSNKTIHVDVRLIAATHRDLSLMIRNNQFREDLFYRLNVFPIEIPRLRERREDIPLLVHYFVSRLSRRMQKRVKSIPRSSMEALTNAAWPGNVRELENFIERALILTQGDELNVPLTELKKASVRNTSPVSSFEEAERRAIVEALKAASGRHSLVREGLRNVSG